MRALTESMDQKASMLGKEYAGVPEPYTLPEKPEDYFPCLMVLAGSGTPILLVSMTENAFKF